MMSSLEYIDSYFNGDLGPEEKKVFDNRISNDEAFAEEVAFYLSTIQAARNELADDKKRRFREIYNEKPAATVRPLFTIWKYAAAATAIIAIVLGVYNFVQPASSQQLATRYIENNLSTINVTMGTTADKLQEGKELYNQGKYKAALEQFELALKDLQHDTSGQRIATTTYSGDAAHQLAGMAALKSGLFDSAISHFSILESNTRLYVNYGKFYHALTLLKRNQPGDKAHGRKLLEEVISKGLAGKEDALAIVKQL